MFGMNFFPEIPRPFNTQYRCYPVAMLPGSATICIGPAHQVQHRLPDTVQAVKQEPEKISESYD